ncbi:MAG TPA: HEAT repeat domain-containing protein, partial [Planctomycetota bacterium]|nr:HEAT repeat domain-containing protein [Planctomycetota bacterium]
MNQACAPYRALLSPALDEALDKASTRRLESHLASCAECRAARERLAAAVKLFRTTPLDPASPDFVERLEARLEGPVRAERAAARAPTVLAVSPPRASVLGPALKTAGLVLCLATSSYLAMEAFTPPRATAPEKKAIEELTPVPPPPSTLPPIPEAPSIVVPLPRPDRPSDPEESFVTSADLTKMILSEFKDPAIFGQNPAVGPVPSPPVVEEPPLLPPPVQGSTAPDKPGPDFATRPRKLDEAALLRLLKLIDDPATPPERRVEMIEALAEFPHRRTYEALASIARGAFDSRTLALESRAAGYETLGKLGTLDAAKTLLALPAPDETKLLLALASLQEAKAIVYVAERAADHASPDARLLCARALGRARKREAVPGLARVLGDARQDALVRAESALALGAIGDPAALEPLAVAVSQTRSKIPIVRAAAARALGDLSRGALGATAARLLVEPVEKDAHAFVREACALALGKSGQVDMALKPLVSRLDPKKEKAHRVRGAADLALVELTGWMRTADEWKRTVESGERFTPRPLGTLALAKAQGWERLLASGQGTVVVLDRSGSMEQAGKIQLAKRVGGAAIESLQETPGAGFDIVAFAEAPTAFFPELRAPTPENVGFARNALELQRPWYAATDLLRAIRAALAIDGVDSVVLLTDGLPTLGVKDPEQLLLEVQRANAAVGARIHVVALRDGTTPLALDEAPL